MRLLFVLVAMSVSVISFAGETAIMNHSELKSHVSTDGYGSHGTAKVQRLEGRRLRIAKRIAATAGSTGSYMSHTEIKKVSHGCAGH